MDMERQLIFDGEYFPMEPDFGFEDNFNESYLFQPMESKNYSS